MVMRALLAPRLAQTGPCIDQFNSEFPITEARQGQGHEFIVVSQLLSKFFHLRRDTVAQASIRPQGRGVDDLNCRNEAWYIRDFRVFQGACEFLFGKILQEAHAVLVRDGINACVNGEWWRSVVVDLVVVGVEVPQQYACILGILFLELDATTATLLEFVATGVLEVRRSRAENDAVQLPDTVATFYCEVGIFPRIKQPVLLVSVSGRRNVRQA